MRFFDSRGYFKCKLDGKKRLVHRVVLQAFLGPCPLGHEVNHVNGVKSDNRAENLEYVTRSANVAHAYGIATTRRENRQLTKLAAKDVLVRYSQGVTKSALAKEFGISRTSIQRLIRRETCFHAEGDVHDPRNGEDWLRWWS